MEKCGKCGCEDLFSGSWAPSRCRNCGATEGVTEWYYDATAQPTIMEIRRRSGYKVKINKPINK